ncbi:MAG: rod shape-determining protein MreB [Halanaerobium sp.]|nr:rod shape-determining protein MreB [Halanaerobium sp.]
MLGLNRKIGIDLGTATVLVHDEKNGIVLYEPSVVAMDVETQEVLAVGKLAQDMLGRTPGNIVAIRPMKEGVIADFEITELMLKHFIKESCGKFRFIKPWVMICVPAGVTEVERRAVLEAAMQVGSRNTFVIEEPVAAAIGAGLPIWEPSGNMVIDIGGGTTDIAVLSLGGIVVSESLRTGGDKFDEAIIRYCRNKFQLLIGERTAEEIKIKVGTAIPGERDTEPLEIRGRDLVNGLPRNIKMTPEQAFEAIEEPISAVLEALTRVLEKTPPELSSDIIDKGLVMTGGGSLLHCLDKYLSQKTGIPVVLADDPVSCVAKGTGEALANLEELGKEITGMRPKRQYSSF